MNRYMIAFGLVLGLLLTAPAEPPRKASRDPGMDTEGVIASNNSFALALYKRARSETKGNLFYSPVSMMSALGLVAVGARGETREQMLNVLHLPPKTSGEALAGFVSALSLKSPPGTHLQMATGLWASKGIPLEEEFLKSVRGTKAQVESLDFSAQPEPSRKLINDWVERQTHRKVRDLLPRGSVTRSSKLVLASAIHFKGNWQFPFRKEHTRDADFHGVMTKARVHMMTHRRELPYANPTGLHVLELPFAGGELGMVFLLPEERGKLVELEDQLDTSNLSAWLRRLEPKRVDVYLPRFQMGIGFELGHTLGGMGMKDAFGPKADLTGISKRGELRLSEAFHRSDISLDEQGAEAAGATAIVVTPKSAEPRVPVFRADHPFIFLVRDRRTGCVLFLGRLAQPRG